MVETLVGIVASSWFAAVLIEYPSAEEPPALVLVTWLVAGVAAGLVIIHGVLSGLSAASRLYDSLPE